MCGASVSWGSSVLFIEGMALLLAFHDMYYGVKGLTFSSMVPVVKKRYTYTLFFWPSRHTRAAACTQEHPA